MKKCEWCELQITYAFLGKYVRVIFHDIESCPLQNLFHIFSSCIFICAKHKSDNRWVRKLQIIYAFLGKYVRVGQSGQQIVSQSIVNYRIIFTHLVAEWPAESADGDKE